MADDALQVPMPVLTRFVRQLSHDLRNHLNAAELQSAFLAEIADNPELKEEVKRLRGMLGEMAASLQKLSASLADVRLCCMPYKAADLIEDVQRKVDEQLAEKAKSVRWDVEIAAGVQLEIDPQLLQQALLELLANASRHGDEITFIARSEETAFIIELKEAKRDFTGDVSKWGREPLHHLTHGHYCLGLYRARRIFEAHDAAFAVNYDDSASLLTTCIALPAARAE